MSPIESILSLFPNPSPEYRPMGPREKIVINGEAVAPELQECPVAIDIAERQKRHIGVSERFGNFMARRQGFQIPSEETSLPQPSECIGRSYDRDLGRFVCCTELPQARISEIVDKQGKVGVSA